MSEGQMVITVTDPQKREQSAVFGIKSERAPQPPLVA
jgi:hypothetical protein